MVNHARAVDNLIVSVAIHVPDTNPVISLAAVTTVPRSPIVAVERPHAGQRSAAPVPVESAVVTVGSIHGGTAHNIIPNECELQLTIRSYKLEVRKALHDAIERKAEGIARSMGARKPRVKIAQLTDALRNDSDLVNRIVPVFQRTIGQSNVIETPPGMGSEDFAMFAQDGVPIFMFALGSVARTQLQRTSQSVGLHSSKYCAEIRPTLTTGITAMVAAACELLPP